MPARSASAASSIPASGPSAASFISMRRIEHLSGSVHRSLHSSVFLFNLARAVEELTLNSLDAGATKVHVSMSVGACYVKVEDNGIGITRDGLVVLGGTHATSKFQNLAGMDDAIGSLGFRGEALSSLSDISLLEVTSKARGKPNAYRKIMKGRKCLFLGIDECRQDVGTTVIVRDLFYNQPVRRKSIQSSPKKALHSVKKCIVRAALAYPQVAFTIIDLERENELLHTIPSSSPLPLVSNHFGSEVSEHLHKVSYSSKELELSGYLSGPADSISTKALQYLYINSRFVSRGAIHKLINNLASRLCLCLNQWRSDSELQKGKRQRTQGCPTYVLNLHCPLSSYNLTFESSKTIVEFKDWAFVLSFIEQAVGHSWKQISALLGESNKESYGACVGSSKKGEILTPDASMTPEMHKNKEYGSCSHPTLFLSPFAYSEELREEDYDVFGGTSVRVLNEKNKLVKRCRSEINWGHQNDYSSKRKLFKSHGVSAIGVVSPKRKTNMSAPESGFSARSHLLSDHILKIDQKDDYLGVGNDLDVDGAGLREFSRWDGSTCHLNKKQYKVPFLLRCSGGLNTPEMESFPVEHVSAESAMSSDHKELGSEFDEREPLSPYGSYLVGAHYSCKSSDFPKDLLCQETLDHFWNSFGLISSFPDKIASDVCTDIKKFHFYDGIQYPKENDISPRLGEHAIEKSFTSQLCHSEVPGPGSPDTVSNCFFTTADDFLWNARSERNCHSFTVLPPREFQTSKLVDSFENYVQDRSINSFTTIGCKENELCFNPGEIYQKHSLHEFKFKNVLHDGANDETACLNSFLVACSGSSNYDKHVDNFLVQMCKYTGGTEWEDFQYCQFSPANPTPRRSRSAPPFYKQKRKLSTIYDYSKNLESKTQEGQSSGDSNMLSATASLLKDPSQLCSMSQPYAKSAFNDLSPELLDRPFGGDRHNRNEIDMVQTDEGSEDDAPEMEYLNANMTKWRGADLHTTGYQGSARSHNLSSYDDDILDISTGLLRLAGSLLVPEYINRDSLENAKVLLQVDRKFIPIIAGGILVAIDQHAADERIRLEELRQKVMSGEGCSIVYLDLEQEILLPEIGLQLLQNYGEQIMKWGWICNAHVQRSGLFAKNLNILKKQSSSVTLLAVPCVLGINLTDKDLLEYLEQLTDTDGASTVPPSVLRILNFKACRGAIMFGDPLLPSECSLIVEELKETSLCFQCAHGRPTTAPLINMVELHKHLTMLELRAESQSQVWHGLQQHQPSVGRAQARLSSAKRFHNG